MARPGPSDAPLPSQPRAGALSRRRALGGASLGLAVPVLAACGSNEAGGAGGDAPTSAAASPAASGPLTTTADVPVGGGAIFEEQGVVVTQPAEGELKAFTNICTHAGCPVSSVEDGTIICTCHGSTFSIETGEVEQGPATEALAPIEITVEGDQISLA